MDGLLEARPAAAGLQLRITAVTARVSPSLKGIEKNLLPYWLGRYPDHELHQVASIGQAAKLVRSYAEEDDPMALRIFEQQASGVGRLFHDCGELHRPGGILPGWWSGRDHSQAAGVVPGAGAGEHRASRRATPAHHPRPRPGPGHGGARGSAIAALASVRGVPQFTLSWCPAPAQDAGSLAPASIAGSSGWGSSN